MGCPGLRYTRLSIYTTPELRVRHLTDLFFDRRYLSSPLLKLCLKLHIKLAGACSFAFALAQFCRARHLQVRHLDVVSC